jgi:hypothetical protein
LSSVRGKLAYAALLLASAVALIAPLGANAATVVNGNFETGNLTGWQIQTLGGSGDWAVYSGSGGAGPPPQGTYAAQTTQFGPGTRFLYQDIALEPGFTHSLSMLVYYLCLAPLATPPSGTLDYTVSPNQQYRIDVMKPSASLSSVSPSDILLNVFQTHPGDPTTLGPTLKTVDLTPFVGQTVRLRFAEVDNIGNFYAAVDAVSLTDTPISNLFTFGHLQRNTRNGTATLAVNVPGPGTIDLTGTGVKTVRPASEAVASKAVAAAGIVKLLIKAKGKKKKRLNKTGKVKVKVNVTFTPTFSTAHTETKRVKLIKKR